MLTYGAFALGAVCMLLGFFNVARGVGAGDSATSVELFGIKFSAQKLAPGLVFSVLGLILVLVAVFVQPGMNDKAGARADVVSGPVPAGDGPAAVTPVPAPAATNTPAATPSPAPTQANQPMTHEEVGALLTDVLTKASQGYCPQADLEPKAFNECNLQLGALQQAMMIAGPVQSVRYIGQTSSPVGTVDQFNVQFQNGQFVWKVGSTENHKISIMWSGPP